MHNNFILKEIYEKKDWDNAFLFKETPFTQSFEYGNWQKRLGRKVRRFMVLSEGQTSCVFQIIFYSLPLGKKFGYIPYGPVANNFSSELLIFLKKEIKKISKEENSIFIRLDFTPPIQSEVNGLFFKSPIFSYTGAFFQPRFEWRVSIKESQEDTLMKMHQKHRYNIRLAEKKGVKVSIITENFDRYLNDFISLLNTTSERNIFSLHHIEYYKNIFKESSESHNIFLSVATFEEKILAIDFVFIFGQTANYVFGGSSSEYRNLCAPHLAQWRALLYAKNLGLEFYNFGGIEDPERKIYKGWEGLTSFKQKFGGEVLKHSNFYDAVSNRFWYFLYNIRKFILKTLAR